ncbi:bifunctional Mitochondrial substrate-solute carrier/P-loop containing nucleoside triphosphate hydrolase/Mitochondrial carrier domain superfamily/GPN-loop GTPase/Mitochondrial phosphate carrier protein Pic2-Mir1-like [Babesia duncani]|uniref:Mitochondrial carrier protein n=1 Tax=Babesia duncani TaxID=323732 RepID=A0AAD9UQ56_9APIC|nr:bifunctional Mitochondrial substrate-solute carrier/P-loop containing nucleoside triphosphate hydrolase/Mitochondrial carrier domain superfamily/GPN-loop GTPase/Mitochondrial phosphate carrier protein Pic2-Mir1-like [Babesia duncani]
MGRNLDWDPRVCSPITRIPHAMVHDSSYYGKCMLGGVLSCGLTHTLVTPLDVTKCRMQTNPKLYKGLFSGLSKIAREEGVAGLVKGWKPTMIGYSLQGLGKFGLYEFFKDFYGEKLGEQRAAAYKGAMWLAASASAEVFADVLLCPMEMVKVKLQTAPVSEKWPSGLLAATSRMNIQRAETKFPFGSLKPLLSRQVPYTMAKFYFFEKVVQFFYDNIFTKPKKEYSKQTQLGITFASGYLAGIICALVSHPADNLVSQLGKSTNKGKGMAGSGKTCYVKRLVDVLKEQGKRVYTINLDPAVTKIPYSPNIGTIRFNILWKLADIRDSIKYRSVMSKYKLGPNGGIMTCLNLFVTRFDKVLEILDRRSSKLDYIVIDTPGQIEVFNWSASGTVSLVYFSNSSVLYKCQLPFLACFNKIDVSSHEICLDWMRDYDAFYEAVMQDDESYMASFSRSCALMLNEFYMDIHCSGVSAKTGQGFQEHVSYLDACKEEYKSVYLPWLEQRREALKKE